MCSAGLCFWPFFSLEAWTNSEVRIAASRGVLAEAKRRTRLTRLSKLRASASAARSTVSSVLAPSPSPPSEPVVPLAPEVASHDPPEVQGCGHVNGVSKIWDGVLSVFYLVVVLSHSKRFVEWRMMGFDSSSSGQWRITWGRLRPCVWSIHHSDVCAGWNRELRT